MASQYGVLALHHCSMTPSSWQQRMADKHQDCLKDRTGSTDGEDNIPSFTPNVMQHLKSEFGDATIDQRDALELNSENDSELLENNRETNQPSPMQSQALDRSQSEVTRQGSNSDIIADSSEADERPNLIYSPDASE